MSIEPLIAELKALLSKCSAKDKELEQREKNLALKETAQVSKEEAFEKRIKEYAVKEENLKLIDGFFDLEKRARELMQDAQNRQNELKEEREKFEIYKDGEFKKIGEELRSIAKEWKKIRGES